MGRIEGLLKAYSQFVAQPWPESLAGAEKVWFAVYEPKQERRLLFRISEFETATKKAGHGWKYPTIPNRNKAKRENRSRSPGTTSRKKFTTNITAFRPG